MQIYGWKIMKLIHSSGKRKTAVARAVVQEGNGKVRINGRSLDSLPSEMAKMKFKEALILAGDVCDNVDIKVNVFGGGVMAQAEACRLAVSKALAQHSKKLEKVFLNYDRNLLVADVRRTEASKPNCRGKARSKKQKSYR